MGMSRREHYQRQFGGLIGPARPNNTATTPNTTSSTTANDFPTFDDADVELILSNARHYRLHSKVLASKSPALRVLLAEQHVARVSSPSPSQIKHTLVLVPNDPLQNNAFEYAFQPVPPNTVTGSKTFVTSPTVLHAFDSVLGTFYNRPIIFDDTSRSNAITASSSPTSDLYAAIRSITSVAESLGCLPLLPIPLEQALQPHSTPLQISISANPYLWLALAEKLQSPTLAHEALSRISAKHLANVAAAAAAAKGASVASSASGAEDDPSETRAAATVVTGGRGAPARDARGAAVVVG